MVRYLNGGSNSGNVGGLDNGQVYYVIVTGQNTIQLALTLENALKATPIPIALTSGGTGTDTLTAPTPTHTFGASQVNTANNTITYDSHGYLNGEAVMYEDGGGTPIGGLQNGQVYYVVVVDTNTIKLSSTAPAAGNTLNIYGTNQAENLLLRASTDPSGYAFVAALNGGADVERINYTASISNLIVNTGNGNDTATLDDNRTETLICAGSGTDTFQVGQIFQSPRDAADAQIAPDDVFTTTLTTRGYLSDGVSYDTTILGGAGTDTFSVFRNLANLDLVGGAGNDTFIIQAFVTESSVLSRVNDRDQHEQHQLRGECRPGD